MTKSSDSFSSLFESEFKNTAPQKRVHVGESVRGRVVRVGKEHIFIELEGHRQAFMDVLEMRGSDGQIFAQEGQDIEARVVSVDQNGEIRLGRSIGKPNNLAALETAKEARLAVDGKVTAANKGGLEVDVSGARAFCPNSQIDMRFTQDSSIYVGRTMQFYITEIRDGGKSIVLSRRALLEAESKIASERTLSSLAIGTIVRGTVTSLREFGAFVDLGGIEGLIPTQELSHERGVKVTDIASPGDVVEVQVREIKDVVSAKGVPQKRITLSLKALQADPWQNVRDHAPVGKVVLGTITRVADFGAFVRIGPGIEGLLHVSELGSKVQDASRAATVGQQLAVVVKRVDESSRRIELGAAPDGAAVGQAVSTPSIIVGSTVTGVVEKIEHFGVFIQIEGTKGRGGRGLIPNAELGTPRGSDNRKLFPEGTQITAKVLETGDGRMRLSIRALKDDEERADFDGYRASTAQQGFGTFAQLLSKKK